MKISALVALVALTAALHASAQSADAVHKALTAEGVKLQAWVADKVFVDAVKQQNAKGTPLEQVRILDERWTAKAAPDLVKQVTTGACADRLRELAAKDGHYSEAFVMDRNGALVCSTAPTTDYWQGDEAKWSNPFNGGAGAVFIDRPKMDDSAHARLAQVSLPIVDGGKPIGVLTVGIRIDALGAK